MKKLLILFFLVGTILGQDVVVIPPPSLTLSDKSGIGSKAKGTTLTDSVLATVNRRSILINSFTLPDNITMSNTNLIADSNSTFPNVGNLLTDNYDFSSGDGTGYTFGGGSTETLDYTDNELTVTITGAGSFVLRQDFQVSANQTYYISFAVRDYSASIPIRAYYSGSYTQIADAVTSASGTISTTFTTSASGYVYFGSTASFSISDVFTLDDIIVKELDNDYTWEGNATFLPNGDSTQILSNIPTELNPNPNFDDWSSYTTAIFDEDFSSTVDSFSTGNSATIALNSGAMRVTNGAAAYGYAYYSFTSIVGQKYRLTWSRVGGTGFGYLHVGTTAGGYDIVVNSTSESEVFTATSTTTYVSATVGGNTLGHYYDYDDVLIEPKGAPDGWGATAMDENNYIIEHASGLEWVNDGTYKSMYINGALTSGQTYSYSITVESLTGSFIVGDGVGDDNVISSTGTTTGTWIADNTTLQIKRNTAFSAVISNFSVEEYHPLTDSKIDLNSTQLQMTENQGYDLTFTAKQDTTGYATDTTDNYLVWDLGNQRDSLLLTLSDSNYSTSFLAEVEDDYFELDGSGYISESITDPNYMGAKVRFTTLGVQQYIGETGANYRLSMRLETDDELSVYAYPGDLWVMNNIDIGATLNEWVYLGQNANSNGMMELYVDGDLFYQRPWNPATIVMRDDSLNLVGDQGIASDGTHIYTSASSTITKYTLAGSYVTQNSLTVHCGGMDVRGDTLLMAWSDNTWASGAVSAIYKMNTSDLSVISIDTINAGLGAGSICYNEDEDIYLVAQNHLQTTIDDVFYKYSTSLEFIDSTVVRVKSEYGANGIVYKDGKYLMISHSDEMYVIDDDLVTIESYGEVDGITSLQDGFFLDDTTLYVMTKTNYTQILDYPFTDGVLTLSGSTTINAGADRNNGRILNGDVQTFHVSTSQLTPTEVSSIYNSHEHGVSLDIDWNGQTTMSATEWEDNSGNNNDGTVTNATPHYMPKLEFWLNDTSKAKLDNIQLTEDIDHYLIEYGDSIYFPFTYDVSTTGTYDSNIVASHTGYGLTDTSNVTYDVYLSDNLYVNGMDQDIDTIAFGTVTDVNQIDTLILANYNPDDPTVITSYLDMDGNNFFEGNFKLASGETLPGVLTATASGDLDTTLIQFMPTANVAYSDTLLITHSADSSPDTVLFTGTGSGIDPGGLANPDLWVNSSTNFVELAWTTVSNAVGFYIYRKPTDGAYTHIATVSPSGAENTTYQDSFLIPNLSTDYYVKAYNASTTANSDTVTSIMTMNASGGVYFVKSGGSDSNSGADTTNAWATIAKVNSSAGSNSIVLFKTGDRFDDAILGSETGITYSTWGGSDLAIIGDSGDVGYGTKSDPTIKVDHEDVTIRSLEVQAYIGYSGNYKEAVISYTEDGLTVDRCEIRGSNVFYHQAYRQSGIRANALSSSTKRTRITNNTIHHLVNGLWLIEPYNVEIAYNTIHTTWNWPGYWAVGGVSISFVGARTDAEYTVHIHHNDLSGFEHSALGVGHVHNTIVEYNYVHDNLDERIYQGGCRSGIYGKIGDGDPGVNEGAIHRYNYVESVRVHREMGYLYSRPPDVTWLTDSSEAVTLAQISTYGGNATYPVAPTENPWYEDAGDVAGSYGRESLYSNLFGGGCISQWLHNNVVYNCNGRIFQSGGDDTTPVTTDGQYYINNTVLRSGDSYLTDYAGSFARVYSTASTPSYFYNNIFDNIEDNKYIDLQVDQRYTYLDNNIYTNSDGTTVTSTPTSGDYSIFFNQVVLGSVIYNYETGSATLGSNSQANVNANLVWNDTTSTFKVYNVGADSINGLDMPDVRLVAGGSAVSTGMSYASINSGSDPSGRSFAYDILGNYRTTNDVGAVGVKTDDAPSLYPTIAGQPVNVNAEVGDTAYFHISASVEGGSVTYQWYYANGDSAGVVVGESTTHIGVDSTTFTIDTVTSAMDEQSFYCIVTNENAPTYTTQSNTVTLDVSGTAPVTCPTVAGDLFDSEWGCMETSTSEDNWTLYSGSSFTVGISADTSVNGTYSLKLVVPNGTTLYHRLGDAYNLSSDLTVDSSYTMSYSVKSDRIGSTISVGARDHNGTWYDTDIADTDWETHNDTFTATHAYQCMFSIYNGSGYTATIYIDNLSIVEN